MKIYPNRWNIPLWELVGSPSPGPEKYLQARVRGAPLDGKRLCHVETGRVILVKEAISRDGDWQVTAKGLAQGLFRAGDRFLDSAYPASWAPEGLFLPQGAMNQGWEQDRATLLGPLVRHGGVPVTVRLLSGKDQKKLFHLSCRGVLLLPGAPYFIEHGSRKVELVLLAAGPFRDKDLDLLTSKAFRFPGLLSLRAIYSINLRHRGWVLLPPELWDESFDEALGERGVRVMRRTLDFWHRKLVRRSRIPGGFSLGDLEKDFGLPMAVGEFLTRDLVNRGELRYSEGRYESSIAAERRLSPYAQTVLHRLQQKRLSGLHRAAFRQELELKGLDELQRLGLILSLEGEWYLSLKSYRAILETLAAQQKRSWTLSELREVLEPSRAFLMALLKEMVARGHIDREEGGWSLRQT